MTIKETIDDLKHKHNKNELFSKDHFLLMILDSVNPGIDDFDDYLNATLALSEALITVQRELYSYLNSYYVPRSTPKPVPIRLEEVYNNIGPENFNSLVLRWADEDPAEKDYIERSLEDGTDVDGVLADDYFETLCNAGINQLNFPFDELGEYVKQYKERGEQQDFLNWFKKTE